MQIVNATVTVHYIITRCLKYKYCRPRFLHYTSPKYQEEWLGLNWYVLHVLLTCFMFISFPFLLNTIKPPLKQDNNQINQTCLLLSSLDLPLLAYLRQFFICVLTRWRKTDLVSIAISFFPLWNRFYMDIHLLWLSKLTDLGTISA